jgi:peptidyl-prolyl cis-trans isomerase B (cyclophilin B)
MSTTQAAEPGLDFMKMPVADLSKYRVVLETNQGNLEIEFWPDVAPNHVRNFLDLSYTGFYDGTTFHRVIPGFMIQGGDPTGTGTGDGKRKLKAEFSKTAKHEAGVLSMARSQSPDSASCQFFVMHARSPHLDGQYSAFGKLVTGLDVVDKIAKTKTKPGDRPVETQKINKARVVKAP